MIYLILSIVFSSLIFIIFKWLGKLQMNTMLIIVMNYFFAGIIGIILTGPDFFSLIINARWILPTILLGSCFVMMFYLMAITTQRSGAAPAVIANKMSVVIPIMVAFIFLPDKVTFLKVFGISLALAGIYLATRKEGKSGVWSKNFLLLLILFLGSGLIDTSIKLIEMYYLNAEDIILFTSALFLTAFISGLGILSLRAGKHIESFRMNMLWMSLFLGLVNFGSIYFLVQALKVTGMDSSVFFPLNNIGIVVLSTGLSVLIFRESLSKINIAGIVVSVLALAILMVSL